METVRAIKVIGSSKTVRRKRSNPFRRPSDQADSLLEYRNSPSVSSTPNSVSASKAFSHDNNEDLGLKFNSPNEENVRSTRRPKVVSEGESKLKKVKLKFGGVTHTIHTKNSSDGSFLAGPSSTKSSYSAHAPHHTRNMLTDQGMPDGEPFSMDKKSGLRGVPWKDFSKAGFGVGNYDTAGQIISEGRVPIKQYDTDVSARKSKRDQKRRYSRGALGDDDDDNENDDEIRYLKKLKSTIKFSARSEDEDEFGSRKHRPLSLVLNRSDGGDMDLKDHRLSRTGKVSRKPRLERTTKDTDYGDEGASLSDTEPRVEPKNNRIREMPNVSGESVQEIAVTTRRRALMSGSSSSVIEFPNGLPPAPSKKQKEQLSEVEQQLRRAEALQRRRMQVEKANRESEAEAIRKILGQDSSRKKREDIVKKRQEEKTASYLTVPSDAVRWVMGPAGTVVIFPEEIGLPSIFEQKASSYPPAREKCAGPSCLNDYKYRDSKSKLPLCSLRCYKAIHEKIPPLTAC